MKADIHPKYNEVVFQDVTSDLIFLTRSTLTSEGTIKWEDQSDTRLDNSERLMPWNFTMAAIGVCRLPSRGVVEPPALRYAFELVNAGVFQDEATSGGGIFDGLAY